MCFRKKKKYIQKFDIEKEITYAEQYVSYIENYEHSKKHPPKKEPQRTGDDNIKFSSREREPIDIQVIINKTMKNNKTFVELLQNHIKEKTCVIQKFTKKPV